MKLRKLATYQRSMCQATNTIPHQEISGPHLFLSYTFNILSTNSCYIYCTIKNSVWALIKYFIIFTSLLYIQLLVTPDCQFMGDLFHITLLKSYPQIRQYKCEVRTWQYHDKLCSTFPYSEGVTSKLREG